MWELGHQEGWVPKNWCFWTVMLEKTLDSPLDCKEIKPVNPKGNQSWIFIGRIYCEEEHRKDLAHIWVPDKASQRKWSLRRDGSKPDKKDDSEGGPGVCSRHTWRSRSKGDHPSFKEQEWQEISLQRGHKIKPSIAFNACLVQPRSWPPLSCSPCSISRAGPSTKC